MPVDRERRQRHMQQTSQKSACGFHCARQVAVKTGSLVHSFHEPSVFRCQPSPFVMDSFHFRSPSVFPGHEYRRMARYASL